MVFVWRSPSCASKCAMPCRTSANSSGLVLATLDHSNLPAASNRQSAEARGNSERTSWAYGSMEVSKDINGGPWPEWHGYGVDAVGVLHEWCRAGILGVASCRGTKVRQRLATPRTPARHHFNL